MCTREAVLSVTLDIRIAIFVKMTITEPKRTRRRVPVLFHISCAAPLLGFGFEASDRAMDIV
jgi:hypothetical protein